MRPCFAFFINVTTKSDNKFEITAVGKFKDNSRTWEFFFRISGLSRTFQDKTLGPGEGNFGNSMEIMCNMTLTKKLLKEV